ncbi:Uncharacterised protein [Acinetobacter baumannii]|nr:Uncharacterised protein [Acinetobacter baumannii]
MPYQPLYSLQSMASLGLYFYRCLRSHEYDHHPQLLSQSLLHSHEMSHRLTTQ